MESKRVLLRSQFDPKFGRRLQGAIGLGRVSTNRNACRSCKGGWERCISMYHANDPPTRPFTHLKESR